MTKKILIFSTAYFPFIGGAEVAVKSITDVLGTKAFASKHEAICFDIITSLIDKKLPKFEQKRRKSVSVNVNVYRIGVGVKFLDKYLLALFGHKKAQELHDKNHYDVVWGIMASYGGFAASAFKKRNPDVPFLLTLQEGDPIPFIKFRALPMWFAFKNIFKRADYIQTISNYLAKFAKDMGLPAGEAGAKCPIDVVPNGVDNEVLSIFKNKSGIEDSRLFRSELGFQRNEKIIITTSRLVKKNAVDDVIRAMCFLPKNYKFLILGKGSDEEKLKALSKKLGVQDRVVFNGNVPPYNVSPYLAESDVFVRPSRSEGLGNSFLEAMAAEVPIIGTKVGGIPDFLKDGETGLFCEVNNPKSIAEKILWLTDPKNETQKNQIIANAKKLVQEKYDWNLIAGKMRGIFEKLTNKK